VPKLAMHQNLILKSFLLSSLISFSLLNAWYLEGKKKDERTNKERGVEGGADASLG